MSGEEMCRDCGLIWRAVRRGECSQCGSDAGPVPSEATEAGEGCVPCEVCGGSQSRGWHKHPAEPGAGEVARSDVDKILTLFPMDEHGTGHIADCGYDANDERCDCFSLPERIATVLAALLDRERRAGKAEGLRESAATLPGLRRAGVRPQGTTPPGRPAARVRVGLR